MAVFSFFSSSTEMNIISHVVIFTGTLLCALYLVLFEWIYFGRFRKNLLTPFVLWICFGQMVSCITITCYYNYDSTLGLYISVVFRLIGLAVINIMFSIIFLHVNWKKYIIPTVILWVIIITVGGVLVFVQDVMFMVLYWFLTLFTGISAFTRCILAYHNGIISIPSKDKGEQTKVKYTLILTAILWAIGGTTGSMVVFGPVILRGAAGILVHPAEVTAAVLIGQMDCFLNPCQYGRQSVDASDSESEEAPLADP